MANIYYTMYLQYGYRRTTSIYIYYSMYLQYGYRRTTPIYIYTAVILYGEYILLYVPAISI